MIPREIVTESPSEHQQPSVDWGAISSEISIGGIDTLFKYAKANQVNTYIRYSEEGPKSIHLVIIPIQSAVLEAIGLSTIEFAAGEGEYLAILQTNRFYVIPVTRSEVSLLQRTNETGEIPLPELETIPNAGELLAAIQYRFGSIYDLDLAIIENECGVEVEVQDKYVQMHQFLEHLEGGKGFPLLKRFTRFFLSEHDRHGIVTRFSLLAAGFEVHQIQGCLTKLEEMGFPIFKVSRFAYSLLSPKYNVYLLQELVARQINSESQAHPEDYHTETINVAAGYRLQRIDPPQHLVPVIGGRRSAAYRIRKIGVNSFTFLCSPNESRVLEALWSIGGYLDAEGWQSMVENKGPWPPWDIVQALNIKLSRSGLFSDDAKPISSSQETFSIGDNDLRLEYISRNIGLPDTVNSNREVAIEVWNLAECREKFPLELMLDTGGSTQNLYRISSANEACQFESTQFEVGLLQFLLDQPGMTYHLALKMLHFPNQLGQDYLGMYRLVLDSIRKEGIVTFFALRNSGYTMHQIEGLFARLNAQGIYLQNIVGVGWQLSRGIAGEVKNKSREYWLGIISRQVGATLKEDGHEQGELFKSTLVEYDFTKLDIPLLSSGEMQFVEIRRAVKRFHLILTGNEASMLRLLFQHKGYMDKVLWIANGGADDSMMIKRARNGLNRKLGRVGLGYRIRSTGVGYSLSDKSREKYLLDITTNNREQWSINGHQIQVVDMESFVAQQPGSCLLRRRGKAPACDFVVFGVNGREIGLELTQAVMDVLRLFVEYEGQEIELFTLFPDEPYQRERFTAAYRLLWKTLRRVNLTQKSLEELEINTRTRHSFSWFWP